MLISLLLLSVIRSFLKNGWKKNGIDLPLLGKLLPKKFIDKILNLPHYLTYSKIQVPTKRVCVINFLDLRSRIILILFLFLFRGLFLEIDSYANPLQESEGITYTLSSHSSTSTHQYVIPFETIAKGAWLGGGIKKAGLITICSDTDLKKTKTRLPNFNWEKLKGTNFDIYMVVMIFLGVKPTSAYGVKIREILREGKIVRIEADLEKCSIGEPAFHVPYQVVGLRKADLGVKGKMTFILLDSAGKEVSKSISDVK